MSVTEIPGRPGFFRVVVYDKVTVKGEKPAKTTKVIEGQRKAEKVERDLLAARDKGSLRVAAQSLATYADHFLASRRAEVSAQTLAGYVNIVERYIKPYPIGSVPVGKVTVTTVAEFYADLLENGSRRSGVPVQVATVRGVHRVLSMMLKRATVDGLLHANPCLVAKPPKSTEVEDDYRPEPGIDPELAAAFLEYVRETPIYTIAAVALGTGLRRSELLALRWQDIDSEGGRLDVNGKIEQVGGNVQRIGPKTKRSRRTVPYGANVAAVLKHQKARVAEVRLKSKKDGLWVDEPWVFPSLRVSFDSKGEMLKAGRLWTPNAFAQEWRQIMADVNGIRLGEFVQAGGAPEDFEPWEFGIHAMRHAYATAQLALGVRDEVVSRRLGHSSSLVTRKVYSHVLDTEVRDGVDEVDGLLRDSHA